VDIFFLVLHVVLSLGIITLVLLQKGAGASAGASFGGGAGSVFGASGSSNFLSKATAIFAIGFFLNSLLLAYMASHRDMKTDSVLDALTAPATELSVPADVSSDVPAADIEDIPISVEPETAAEDDVPPPAGE
jgi:preprotein translocase subunit SecG